MSQFSNSFFSKTIVKRYDYEISTTDTDISSQEDYRLKFEHYDNMKKLLITLLESIFQTYMYCYNFQNTKRSSSVCINAASRKGLIFKYISYWLRYLYRFPIYHSLISVEG